MNSFHYIDNIHDVLAVYVNRLMDSTLRSEYKNIELLTADRVLTDGDAPIQRIDCGTADRVMNVPPASDNNHLLFITNASAASRTLTIKSNDGGTTYQVLAQAEGTLLVPDGNGGYKDVVASAMTSTVKTLLQTYFDTLYTRKSTAIEGLKLIWNSSSSISVSTGSCYAENGDFINVTAELVKSALALSSNAWYHVYVYLAGGVAAAEVVTTAPVAWKGTAYSKTGNTSRRYVGSIRTSGGSVVLSFTMQGNQVLYAEDEPSLLRVLTGGSSTSEADISLATRMPVTSRMALLTFVNSSASAVLFTGASGIDNVQPPTTGIVTCGPNVTKSTWHPTDENQNISYALNATGGSINVNCSGYIFDR